MNPIYHAGFLVHLGRFYRGNLREFVKRIQVQFGSRQYLLYSLENLYKRRRENNCYVFSKKFLEFLCFVILFSSTVYLFKFG